MLLVESQILPPAFVFVEAIYQKGLLIELNENYQKKSLRNRFYIASVNSVELVTIPLTKGKAQNKPIQEVTISYAENWVEKLRNRLNTAYGSAPYFHDYFDTLMDVFEMDYSRLIDLNNHLLKWIIESTGMHLETKKTDSYVHDYDLSVVDWRNKDLSFYQNYSSNSQLVYDQIFDDKHGFIRNLSILDLLFNVGPESGLVLSKASER